MVMIVTAVAVNPGREEEWEAVWRQLRAVATAQPGFRSMTLLREGTQPGHYVVVGSWDSQAAYDQFRRRSGVEWLNRGLELWTAAPPRVYDEVVEAVESERHPEG
jgi:heme-degrading monooxygenase HmoA